MTPEDRETLDELVLSMIAALNHEQINYGGRLTTVTVDGSDLAALRAALVALDGADDRLRAAQEATWRRAADVVDYETGRDLDILEAAYNEDTAASAPVKD